MSVSLDFLVKVVQLELKEVENELNGLKELYSNRRNSSEISKYVFLENTAVLQSEIASIHQIEKKLDSLDIDATQTPHELLDSIDDFIKLEISKRQYSQAIYNFIKIKLVKISKYLDM